MLKTTRFAHVWILSSNNKYTTMLNKSELFCPLKQNFWLMGNTSISAGSPPTMGSDSCGRRQVWFWVFLEFQCYKDGQGCGCWLALFWTCERSSVCSAETFRLIKSCSGLMLTFWTLQMAGVKYWVGHEICLQYMHYNKCKLAIQSVNWSQRDL